MHACILGKLQKEKIIKEEIMRNTYLLLRKEKKLLSSEDLFAKEKRGGDRGVCKFATSRFVKGEKRWDRRLIAIGFLLLFF